jgi:hypothetical protein
MRRAAVGFLLGALLSACVGLGAGDALDPLPAPEPSEAGAALHVEIGTGASSWEPLAAEQPVDVVAGPQGGFHLWTSVRVQEPAPDHARIDLDARFVDDGSFAGNPSSVATALVADGAWRSRVGMTNFVTDPASVRGRRILLSVRVFGPDGRSGSDARVVVPR